MDKEGRDVTSRPPPLPHLALTTEKSGGPSACSPLRGSEGSGVSCSAPRLCRARTLPLTSWAPNTLCGRSSSGLFRNPPVVRVQLEGLRSRVLENAQAVEPPSAGSRQPAVETRRTWGSWSLRPRRQAAGLQPRECTASAEGRVCACCARVGEWKRERRVEKDLRLLGRGRGRGCVLGRNVANVQK